MVDGTTYIAKYTVKKRHDVSIYLVLQDSVSYPDYKQCLNLMTGAVFYLHQLSLTAANSKSV